MRPSAAPSGSPLLRKNVLKKQPRTVFLLPTSGVDDDTFQRNMVLNEILSTERDFVADMENVLRIYVSEIRERDLLPKEDMDELFGNLDEICGLHKILLEALGDTVKDGGSVGAVFVAVLNEHGFDQAYKKYTLVNSNCKSVLERVTKNEKEFRRFLESDELRRLRDAGLKRLDLESLLIKPVQRICKYPLLLSDLRKKLQGSEADMAALSQAITQTDAMVKVVNESQREAAAAGYDASRAMRESAAAMRNGEHSLAIATLKELLSMQPEDPGALYMMATAKSEDGDQAGALDFLTKALAAGYGNFANVALDPHLVQLRATDAYVELVSETKPLKVHHVGADDPVRKGLQDLQFRRQVEKAREKMPQGEELVRYKEEMRRRYEEQLAEAEARKAEVDAQINDKLKEAILSIYKKEYRKARTTLREVLALRATHKTAWFHMACVEAELGRYDDAFDALRTSLHHGFETFNAIETSAPLQTLRTRKGALFERLVAEYRLRALNKGSGTFTVLAPARTTAFMTAPRPHTPRARADSGSTRPAAVAEDAEEAGDKVGTLASSDPVADEAALAAAAAVAPRRRRGSSVSSNDILHMVDSTTFDDELSS